MTDHEYAQLLAKQAAAEQEHESFKRRLSSLETESKEHGAIVKEIWQLSAAIKSILESQKRTEEKIKSIDTRVGKLESEPAEKWRKITWEVIKAVVLAAAGVIIGKMIGG